MFLVKEYLKHVPVLLKGLYECKPEYEFNIHKSSFRNIEFVNCLYYDWDFLFVCD